MKNLRVKTAKAHFCNTSRGMQPLITKSTTFEEVNGAQQCPPLHITDLGKLNVYENTKVNVAGIITHIRPLEDFSGAEKLTITIRDLTASIDISCWRQRALTFTGKIGQRLLLEGVQVKNYGKKLQCH